MAELPGSAISRITPHPIKTIHRRALHRIARRFMSYVNRDPRVSADR
jgi:hypothetical protein